MDRLWLDLRYAARLLLRAPVFALTVIAILALGIGANTAMFSVVDAVLVRPPPFPDADRIMVLWTVQPMIPRSSGSGPDYADWKAGAPAFAAMTACEGTVFNLADRVGTPQPVSAGAVTSDFFAVMGVRPALGRGFTPDEDRPGGPRVAVISDRLFRTRFGGDAAAVLGRPVRFDGVPYTVIGVMPPGFRFVNQFVTAGGDAWVPLGLDPATGAPANGSGRGNHFLTALGRLRPGVTRAQAQAQLDAVSRRLATAYPNTNTGVSALAEPLHDALVRKRRGALLVLLAAIAMVLLVACVNVANLLLARAAARQPELAVRVALGASRARLVRQLLTESALLGLLGGAAGALVSTWAVDWIAATVLAERGGAPTSVAVAVDARALAFTLGLALATSALFGTAPALLAADSALQQGLKQGAARGSGGGGLAARARKTLIVAEVSLAFALLVTAGLLLTSFLRFSRVDTGFDPAGVATTRMLLPAARYGTPEGSGVGTSRATDFVTEVVRRLEALPGATAAGAITTLPLSESNNNGSFDIEGRPPWPRGHEPLLERRSVTAGYFRAMGIALRRGRLFDARDTALSRPVLLVSESVVRRFFPGQDPIGQRIRWDGGEPFREIVGVVEDTRSSSGDLAVHEDSYAPYAQAPRTYLALVVHTAGDPAALARPMAATVAAVDPDQAVFDTQTMAQRVARTTGPRRLDALLLALFAVAALLLAAMGIFGMVAYQTAQRTREIGIRVALGARPGHVVRLVVAQATQLVLLGLALGVPLALGAGRAVARLLYGVGATEPAVLAVVAALLALVGLGASLMPALRALRISPAAALRCD